MRSRPVAIIPPYNDQVYPHEAFPPWKSLMRVLPLVAAAMRRRGMTSKLKCLEVALVQAAQRIAQVACGDLPVARWLRRARVAVDKLDRAKLTIVDFVATRTLELSEAQELVEAIDIVIAQLLDEVVRAPLPDELRAYLLDLQTPLGVGR